jgi:hypothetical protein
MTSTRKQKAISTQGKASKNVTVIVLTNLYIRTFIVFISERVRDSSVGIATGYGLDGSGIEFR